MPAQKEKETEEKAVEMKDEATKGSREERAKKTVPHEEVARKPVTVTSVSWLRENHPEGKKTRNEFNEIFFFVKLDKSRH